MASSSSPSSATMWPGKHRGAAAAVRRAQLVLSRDAGWCGQRVWRKLLRRLAQETRCICNSPTAAASRPIMFGYDAVSYAKNFDDGLSPVPPCAAPVPAANNAADKSIDN
ncbi:hypothetical protein PR202_gb04740 [Eleusine coracana subsp. coracana]|uniref:Uncharacterized protein n=1 Tax=Eleusine coracana subsp. coracana TaxID=191504 RepID=A0AAV5E2S0_ELECO|nr:hypothetical protein QOZ80_1BG0083500 [Eleusine coracana subsp. coracana]GJN17654.1 hypothetical protein PR202_gb04740 [Eleusine coracana subsp. coracana]